MGSFAFVCPSAALRCAYSFGFVAGVCMETCIDEHIRHDTLGMSTRVCSHKESALHLLGARSQFKAGYGTFSPVSPSSEHGRGAS